jgi:hypothetical protein
VPILVLTSDLPTTPKARIYLADLAADVWDVIGCRGDLRGFQRLRAAFNGPMATIPPDAPWRHRPTVDDGDQMTLSFSEAATNGERQVRPNHPA